MGSVTGFMLKTANVEAMVNQIVPSAKNRPGQIL